MSEGWGRGSIGVSNSGTSGRKRKMMGEDTGEDIEQLKNQAMPIYFQTEIKKWNAINII